LLTRSVDNAMAKHVVACKKTESKHVDKESTVSKLDTGNMHATL